MARPIYKQLMNNVVAAASGSAATDIGDFGNLELEIITVGSGSATIKVQGSFREAQVDTIDFSTTASPTNPWFYVETTSLDSGTGVAGSTGYSLTGATCIGYQVNCDNLQQLNVTLGTVSGTLAVYVRLVAFNDYN